ncbi:MAG: hypothetical protein ACR650_10725 [Methylocystis sp.]
MRKRLFASLIVCVALLTQLGASLWGAAAARDGYTGCHKQAPAFAIADARGANDGDAPSGAPAPHGHATCFLCQFGFTAIDTASPALSARPLLPYRRVTLVGPDACPRSAALNWNALARAPPPSADPFPFT